MSTHTENSFLPVALPAGVVGRRVDDATARIAQAAIGAQIFPPGETFGHFRAPKARQRTLDRLQAQYAAPCPTWIVFYSNQDAPVGYFYGYMEDGMTLFIDTVGLIPSYRNRGIYTAFLRKLIATLGTAGYERLTTSHHPNNRAIMIAELKAGFNIVGIELHEECGPLVKMAYLFHPDRREGFRRAFSMAPDPASGAG